jgi:hypothetical protein
LLCLISYLLFPFNLPKEPNGGGTLSAVTIIACQLVVTWPTTGNSSHTAAIDILDDDSLLNIFHLYRPFLLGEDDSDSARLFGGSERWERGHWWYKLAHVYQKWRNLILGSASYLGLCLVCTKGTPVADMLAHSPPLPFVVDYYYEGSYISTEDEGGLILALGQRDRVARIRLSIDVPNLQRLIAAIGEEYPILEYLIIVAPDSPSVTLPERLQAPHLRHLVLSGISLPIGSRLLTTAVGLVTLVLMITIPSTYFQPNSLLQWVSFMPQLETLIIFFLPRDPSRPIEIQLTDMPTITPITLPNLRWFGFHGPNDYLEAVVCWITSPRLEKIQVVFDEHLAFSVTHLLQFLHTTETRNLGFSNAELYFSSGQVEVAIYPRGEADLPHWQSLHIRILCPHLDLQVSAMAQILNSLGRMFAAVEHLTFVYEVHSQSSEEHNVVDRIEWRKILRSFSNAKTLRVAGGLDEEIARCLRSDDGELLLDLLPELHELTYSRNTHTDNEFASFINTRQNAGRPITLVDLSLKQAKALRSDP